MSKHLKSRIIIILPIFIFFLIASSDVWSADVIIGNITNIEGTRFTIENETDQITVTGKSLNDISGLSVGDYAEVEYIEIGDTFLAENISIIEQK